MNLAVVAAAGRSSRLGRNKALVRVGGAPVLETLLNRLARGGVERSVVVAAAGDRPLAERCAILRVELAVNEAPEQGMLSSIRLGLDQVIDEARPEDRVVVCPVDFPAVDSRTIASLLAALASPEVEVAVPLVDGRRGHPLALRSGLAATLRTLDPEVGLRQIFDRARVFEVPVDDPGVRLDLDSWRDLSAIENALGREER